MTISKYFGCIILLILVVTMSSGCMTSPSSSDPTPVDYSLLKADHFDKPIHFISTARVNGGNFNQYSFVLPDGESTYHIFIDLPSRSNIRLSASTSYLVNFSRVDRFGTTYSLVSGGVQNLGWVSIYEGPINSTVSFPKDSISPIVVVSGYNAYDIDAIVKIDKVT